MTETGVRVTGLVARPTHLGVPDLDAASSVVEDAGSVAEGAVGTAIPVSAIMAQVRLSAEARYCTVSSMDGAYRASIPVADLREGGWLAFRLGAEPLPAEQGGPYRLTVAQGSTLCWNVKHVGELRFTAAKEPDSVPANPTH